MSNSKDAKPRREEEIAFLAMEQALGVDIRLADAGGGNGKPDGAWQSVEGSRKGIVEITSPPDEELMRQRAHAKRDGDLQKDSGSVPARLNDLANLCMELLAEEWAQKNIEKLQAQPADERHLFLYAHGEDMLDCFGRLSDVYQDGSSEAVEELVLPDGISDVWFRGRAWRESRKSETFDQWMARYQVGEGWHRYVATIKELELPSPPPGLAEDPMPLEKRHPKDRTILMGESGAWPATA